MATGSISNFLSSFNKELARPNHYDVLILPPTGLVGYVGFDDATSRNLRFRCESTELPGRSLMTTSMKIYGIEEKYPYMSSYNDISLTFIVSDDMSEKKFFETWINYIHPSATFNFKYKEDYSTGIIITQYDLKKTPTYTIRLLKAYPIAVNPLSLDWGSDGYHKLTVTFVYDYWENLSVTQDNIDEVEIQNQNKTVASLVKSEIIYKGTDFLTTPPEV